MVVKVSKPEINVREKISELDKPSGTAGQTMLAAETPQEQFNLISAGRRRLNINGDMRVWQRGTSFTGLTSGNTYTADRYPWKVTSAGAWTVSREADAPSGFKYSFKALCTSGDSTPTQLRLYHSIEGQDVHQLAYGTNDAKPISVSFWVKSNVTGMYTCSLETHVPGRQASLNFTIDGAGVWEKKELTFQGDSSSAITNINGVGLTISLWFGSSSGLGSGGITDGAWVTDSSYTRLTGGLSVNLGAAANNYVQFTGIQIEEGKVATPFEHRAIGEELALCQRYFEMIEFENSMDQNGSTAVEMLIGNGFAYTGGRTLNHLKFNVQKRTPPVVTINTASYYEVLDSNAGWVPANLVNTRANVHGVRIDAYVAGNVLTPGRSLEVRLLPNGKISIDAET